MAKKVVKEFNNGTMTKASFFSMIRSALRNRSRFWKPISEVKKLSRREYKGDNKRQKWEYKCYICKGWFKDDKTQVDHIKPVGELNDYKDLPNFVKTLFCEKENLAVVCKTCHQIKTNKEKNERLSVSSNSRNKK